jgi:Domain of unknown function (DUF5666)
VRIITAFAIILATTVGPVSTLQAQAPGPRPDAKTEKPKKATRNVSGTVRSAAGDTVVVAGRDKGRDAEWTFAIDPMTHIRKGSKSIVAGDLKPGDAVQVRYLERDGKAQAESILVKAPRK